MALSLPNLPAELLLEIADSLEPSQRRKTMEQLRATHPQIDEKIVHAYVLKYHKSVDLYLERAKLTSFQSIAASYLGANIESLSINLSDLLKVKTHRPESDSTDIEESVAMEEARTPGQTEKYYFNEDFFNFITDGSCTALFERTLPKLQNNSSLTIRPVRVPVNLSNR
jgi:hypothetical protein